MNSKTINKYEWNLEAILDKETFDNLYKLWLNKQNEILDLYKNFTTSLNNFKKWIKLGEEYEILSNRVSNYISNHYNENLTDPKWIAWDQKLGIDSNNFSVKLSGLSNKIIQNQEKILSYLKDDSLYEYQREYELIFRTKPHVLPDDQQKVLSTAGIINSGFHNIFSTLSDGEVKFKDAIDKKGSRIPLKTISDVMIHIKSKDRNVRKTTWLNFHQAYHSFENTFTQTLYYNYLMLNTNSKIHHFNDYVHATAFTDEIDINVILSLYKDAEIFKNTYQAYRKVVNQLLKKQLKLNKLEPWDKTVDLTTKKDLKFTIDETQQIVLEALLPLGNVYINQVRKIFNENWISWLSSPGKYQGAYSIDGTKGLEKYYILMNFDKSIRSIFTIAHEIGHSMNSYYINKNQPIYTGTSIFYAEIASIVNEMLIAYYFLDKYKENSDLKKMILDELISNFFNTVTRQIIFSNTEFELNRMINASQPFTKEVVKSTYLSMIEKYEGIDNEMKKKLHLEPYSFSQSTILRIPHFYAGNFYVYKYAIGQIVAILIAKKIYDGEKRTINNYFKFLSSGSSLSPMDTIKLLGVDILNKNIYDEVNRIVKSWIDILASLKNN